MSRGERRVNAKSIMGVMLAAGISTGGDRDRWAHEQAAMDA
jgi:phosphotransferase system HPr-like phosphotransfer protein